jgi:hypothetical protein
LGKEPSLSRSFCNARTASFAGALALVGCMAVIAAGGGSARAATAAHRLTLYSVAEQEQYVNNSDSRILGIGNNPFGNFKDTTAATSKGNGPFPGDEALFSFNLYSDPSLKTRAGSATFTCQYNFNKNVFCDAAFKLKNGGTLIASGGFNFNTSKFTLAVTGGYGAFADRSGIVQETPSSNHAQRLAFVLD